MKLKELAAVALIVSMSLGTAPAEARDTRVVDRVDLEQALLQRAEQAESARADIRALLARKEVQALASDLGLDVRKATNAVGTLEGRELEETAARARVASDALSGGAQTIQISIVTLLLVIIIIILLVD